MIVIVVACVILYKYRRRAPASAPVDEKKLEILPSSRRPLLENIPKPPAVLVDEEILPSSLIGSFLSLKNIPRPPTYRADAHALLGTSAGMNIDSKFDRDIMWLMNQPNNGKTALAMGVLCMAYMIITGTWPSQLNNKHVARRAKYPDDLKVADTVEDARRVLGLDDADDPETAMRKFTLKTNGLVGDIQSGSDTATIFYAGWSLGITYVNYRTATGRLSTL